MSSDYGKRDDSSFTYLKRCNDRRNHHQDLKKWNLLSLSDSERQEVLRLEEQQSHWLELNKEHRTDCDCPSCYFLPLVNSAHRLSQLHSRRKATHLFEIVQDQQRDHIADNLNALPC